MSESRGKRTKQKPGAKAAPVAKASKREWPKTREAQAKAVAGALRECDGPVAPDELAKRFTRAQRDVIEELLQAMVTLGLARRVRGGRYSG